MTDYLAETMKTGALLEQVKRSERKSTAHGRDVEKKGDTLPAPEVQRGRSGEVFHALHRSVEEPGAPGWLRSIPVEGRGVPEWSGGVPAGEAPPFPAPAQRAEQSDFPDAEAVDRAFQRDSRRYDGGFFLY